MALRVSMQPCLCRVVLCIHPGVIGSTPTAFPPRRAPCERCCSLHHSLITYYDNGFIAYRPIPGMPRGGVLPPIPVLRLGWRLGRVPALPYPPPR